MISKNLSSDQLNLAITNYNILKVIISSLPKYDKPQETKILIASKYFDELTLDKFIQQTQHKLFGENIIQDAEHKWGRLKKKYPDIKLHFIGKLQSNKIKSAVKIFNTIETVSSINTALMIKNTALKLRLPMPVIFLQINIGEELKKNGFTTKEFIENFRTINDIMQVKGIMCIPPQHKRTSTYFIQMRDLAKQFSLSNLSMGMTNDYKDAIKYGSTQIRIGRFLLDGNAFFS